MKVVVPALVSTRGYGILLDSYSFMEFHDDDAGSFLWTDVDDDLDFYFIYGPEFDDIVHQLRCLTGHAPMLRSRYLAGVQATHVPFRGSGPMLTELVAERVDCGMDNIPSALPFIRDDKIRAIGVTSAARNASMPNVPTIAESGLKGFEADNWFGVLAPEDTPAHLVTRLNAEIVKAVANADLRKRMIAQGAQLQGSTPAELAAIVRSDVAKWTKVIRDAGVTLIVVLLALKTLELRARRDAFVVFFLGFFTLDPSGDDGYDAGKWSFPWRDETEEVPTETSLNTKEAPLSVAKVIPFNE